MRAVGVVVTGRVQGVSFRMYAAEEGRRLGLTGWVRNEQDGSVAAHLEGDDDAVAAMLAWCRTGPPAARVEHVAVAEAEPTGATSFTITY
ncbi:acylphosphatase [Nocardioides mangrovi]|uniref:Acylphosphatase n=1 Tax=Nocardioides mangrovi TaxID=2874580 RepID=A0ABS7UBG1_9ACTN|nr:acylphosphatase [Nocardioides mangrovi]MBZ5738333.1 acylphosphatase [Nocardioides mangrovi]